MKYIIKFIVLWFIAVMTLPFHSCDYLNVNDYFNESLKYDSIFSNKRNVERYLWATAAVFPDEGNYFSGLNSFASDEVFSVHPNDYPAANYTLGSVTPTNTGGTYIWGSMYIIIRKANTILANIDKPYDMSALDRREILGFTYFMRAYAYYRLLMQYGPLVILGDDVLETNEDTEYYDRTRETFDASVDYVCAEFEKAAAYMERTVPFSLFGRPTRGAALGLIARLRLIQASPLWNGGEAARRTYSSWKRSTDGENYVSQTYEERKWAEAAMACKRIINMNLYSLHTVQKMPDTNPLPANVPNDNFPNGAGDIDPFRSYSDMFTGEALIVRNPEYLWAFTSSASQKSGLLNFTRHSFPVGDYNGWNTIAVTQKVVDAYRMVDGRSIESSSEEYPYTTNGFLGGADRTFSGYRLSGLISNMYANREMRFYASIGFSEAILRCNSYTGSKDRLRNQRITYYIDGNAGKNAVGNNINNYCGTGYTLRKFVHEDDAWGDNVNGLDAEGAKRLPKAYSIIRYAEILLSYVEALNNLTTSHTLQDTDGNSYTITRDRNEMRTYFNMVRYRAGLPGLTDEELASVQNMQDLIERERLVEFLLENIRYHDVRRWGKYELSEKEPIMGMDIDASRTGGYYNVIPVNHSRARTRVVDRKLILCPIILDEVRKSPSLDQNPGWQF